MKIYIDGEKLMESFYDTPKSKRSWSRAWWLINHAKLADVRENVSGEWIRDKKTEKEEQLMFHKVWTCSECGEQQCRPKPSNFCPNCGADMRGQTNEYK